MKSSKSHPCKFFFSSFLTVWVGVACASADQVLYQFPTQGIANTSSAGDINGDGVADIIVGDFFNSTAGSSAGAVKIYSGLNGSLIRTHLGTAVNQKLGFQTGSMGDVNGDGSADYFIVALPLLSTGVPPFINVYSGASGSLLYSVNSGLVGDQFGQIARGGKDVNGDGIGDLVVGAYLSSNNGLIKNGRVSVFSGTNGALLYNVDGQTNNQQLGYNARFLNDTNGDGLADVIISTSAAGTNQVLSGPTGSVLLTLPAGNGAAASAGDIDFDGSDDISIGFGIYSGSNGALLKSLTPPLPIFAYQSFGWDVNNVGDANCDGYPDLLISDANLDCQVFFDIFCGVSYLFSGKDGSVLFEDFGMEYPDELGFSLAGAGDLNNDGAPDFLVSQNGVVKAHALTSPTWCSLGSGLAGINGTPQLTVSGALQTGSNLTVTLNNSKPSAPGYLVISPTKLNAPLKGGTLVPAATIVIPATLDGAGTLTFSTLLPAALPSMTKLYLQYWIKDPAATEGFSASNAVIGNVP